MATEYTYKNAKSLQSDIIKRMPQDVATEEGQPLRRIIIDPVAAILEEAYRQDAKTRISQRLDDLAGIELDAFFSNFGFLRRKASYASGIIKFKRRSVADQIYYVPWGAKISTIDGIVFRTSRQGILQQGETYVEIQAEAEISGTTGNVAADTIIQIISGVTGVTSVTNELAFSGGAEEETDAEAKERFKVEVLKNIAGTRAFYLGLPMEFDEVTKSSVVTACETNEELVEFEDGNPSPGTSGADLSFDNVYASNVYVQDEDQTKFYTEGADWELASGMSNDLIVLPDEFSNMSPSVTGNTFPYYWATYEFLPECSRGTGCIEVYLTGSMDEVQAFDTFVFATGTDDYFFTLTPVNSIENVVDENGNPYIEDTDYELVHDIDNYGWSPSAGDYIHWLGASTPGDNDSDRFTVEYYYNPLPWTIQDYFQDRKPVCDNVLVHMGVAVALEITMKVIFDKGYDADYMEDTITTQLETYINLMAYGMVVQFSDIEYWTHLLLGVDNVEVTQIIATPADTGTPVTHTSDFRLDLNQYATFGSGSLTILQKTYNTWI